MTTTVAGFGKTKLTGEGFFKRFRLESPKNAGESTVEEFRIIPPIKSLADDGIWKRYFRLHFGFKARNPRDQTKTIMKPFLCILDENRKTGEVLCRCPQCEVIERREAQVEAIEAQGKLDKKTDDQIETLTASHKAWLREFNTDSKWYINVMNTKGEFGVLAISHRLQTQLNDLLKKLLESENIDATDPTNGLFLKFTRTGKGRETQDKVDVAMTKVTIDGRVLSEYKRSSLTEAQVKDALRILPDLDKEVVTRITSEQIGRLVGLGTSPDPDLVDAIFGSSQKHERKTAPKEAPAVDPTEVGGEDEPAEQAATPPAAEPPAAEDDEEAKLAAQLAAVKAAKAAKAAAAAQEPPKTPPAPKAEKKDDPAPQATDDLSDDEFISMFGSGTAGAGNPVG